MTDFLTCTSNLVEEVQLEFIVNLDTMYKQHLICMLEVLGTVSACEFFVTIQSRSVCSQADTDINQSEL